MQAQNKVIIKIELNNKYSGLNESRAQF